MKDSVKLNCAKKPLMVAHRGLSGLEKENSAAAFIAAGNRSYYGIETDVHRTADGHFVCIHDYDTARVSADAPINVEEKTLEEIRAIRLNGAGEEPSRGDLCIPTLQEYIRICKAYGKIAVLELKGTYTKETLGELCAIIEKEEWMEGTVFIAFGLDNLIILRELYPTQPAQYLLSKTLPEDMYEILDRYNFDLDIYYGSLTQEMLDKIHAAGHKVNVWTVDKLDSAEVLSAMGVDYITSNILE